MLGVAVGIGVGLVMAPEAVEEGPLEVPRPSDDAPIRVVEVPVAAASGDVERLEPDPHGAAEDARASGPGDGEAAADDDGPLISARLMAWARTRYLETAQAEFGTQPSETTTDGAMELFRQGVMELPATLAREHGPTREHLLEATLATGDGAEFLRLVKDGVHEPAPGEGTGDFLDAAVHRRSASGTVDGGSFLDGDDPVTEGLSIVFGPGLFELDEKKLRGEDGRTLPPDVSVSGAGMDATLVKLSDISIKGDVERFSLSDLTIDCDEDGLFDIRSGGVVLDLLRVRIVRFDASHGGANIFTGRAGALVRARSCQFLGGYGKSPGGGRLFDVRSPANVFARFDDCHFDLLGIGAAWGSSHLDFRFVGCRLDRLDEAELDHMPASWFVSCDFGPTLPMLPDPDQARDLTELFPNWK